MNLTLKKIVNISLSLIILDILLDYSLYCIFPSIYPSIRRLDKINRRLL